MIQHNPNFPGKYPLHHWSNIISWFCILYC